MQNLSALWTVMRRKQSNYTCMTTKTGGMRRRTKVIINGKSKIAQTSIMKQMRDTQQRRPTKKSLLLKSKIKKIAITLTKMIKIITCDIRTTYLLRTHTYQRLK